MFLDIGWPYHAYDQSLTADDLMDTRAFPIDGVLQFKRRWGAVLDDFNSPSSILFKPLKDNAKAANFSQQFPLIARRDGALELVVCSLEPEFDDAACKRTLSSFYCDGIDQVTVVHLSDQYASTTLTVSKAYPNVRVVRCTLQDFSQYYTRDFNFDNVQAEKDCGYDGTAAFSEGTI